MKQITLFIALIFSALHFQAQDLKITEIMYNPSGADTNWEWIEIYNNSTEPINLAGYVFDDNTATPLTTSNISTGIIPVQEAVILFNAKNITVEQFKEVWGDVNAIAVSVWPTLGNSGDTIGIWDSFVSYDNDHQSQLNTVEQLIYDSADNGWPNDDGKASIFLTSLDLDNTSGNNWSLSVEGEETPLNTTYISIELHGNSGVDIGSPGNSSVLEDTEKPVIYCSEDVTKPTDIDTCVATFAIELPTATDNSGGDLTFESTRSDGLELSSAFSLGETSISWTAIDEAGNVSEPCLQKIVVIDEAPPELTCPETIIVDSIDGNPVIVDLIVTVVTDLCDDSIQVVGVRSDDKELQEPFPVGETLIVWTAEDVSGNKSECTQTIQVNFTPSSEKDIIAFTIVGQVGETSIDVENKTVTIIMLFGTSVEALIPLIEVSENALVSPASEELNDFTNSVIYTVTAQDDSVQDWVVSVITKTQPLLINSFTLVNADTNEDLFTIEEGMQIDINKIPTLHLDIRANTTANVESVLLSLAGDLTTTRTENFSPYAVYGDFPKNNYLGKDFVLGEYSISAFPYSLDHRKGIKGESLTVNFKILNVCDLFELKLEEKIDPIVCDGVDGSARINFEGGVEPIEFSWSHDENLNSISATDLKAGSYMVIASDANNCTTKLIFELKEPELPEVTLTSFSEIKTSNSAFPLTGGFPLGGVYSGEGVIDGFFDPAIGEGAYEITYNYIDGDTSCQNSTTEVLIVSSEITPLSVQGFTLVNATTNEDILQLTEGMRIDVNTLETLHLNIRAITTDDVESVRLSITGAQSTVRTENVWPYSLYGDFPIGNYFGNNFIVGFYEVTAKPYTGDKLTGVSGKDSILNFELYDSKSIKKNIIQMSIAPNPVRSETVMHFKEPVVLKSIYVYDLLGRIVHSYKPEEVADDTNYILNLNSIPEGTYYIKSLDFLGQQYQKQIVIKK